MFSFAKVRVLCVFVFSLSLSGLTQAAFTGLYSFGDSLSDTGNVNPGAPYVDGNFSNGPVWVDLLGPMLDLASPTASNNGGTNYAWGGARTLVDGGVISTQTQVTNYLAHAGGSADPDALYTIWTGGNDVQAFDIAAGAGVATIAGDLLAAGATNILVLNVPNLGLTPIADGNEAAAALITTAFNDQLALGLATLNSPDVTLVDSFALLDIIVADPAAFGLTNVDDNCLVTTGGMGSACDGYLFWDDLHPTTAGHQLIADAAFAAVVPVPAALWLFGSALMGLVVIKRKS